VAPTFDIVKHVLATRQRWLGHVGHMLRSEEGLLARQVLLAEVSWHKEAGLAYREGSLLSECPAHDSAEHLVHGPGRAEGGLDSGGFGRRRSNSGRC
jgi:hypothetical protein